MAKHGRSSRFLLCLVILVQLGTLNAAIIRRDAPPTPEKKENGKNPAPKPGGPPAKSAPPSTPPSKTATMATPTPAVTNATQLIMPNQSQQVTNNNKLVPLPVGSFMPPPLGNFLIPPIPPSENPSIPPPSGGKPDGPLPQAGIPAVPMPTPAKGLYRQY